MIKKTVCTAFPDGRFTIETQQFSLFAYEDRQFLVNQIYNIIEKGNDVLNNAIKKVLVKSFKAYVLSTGVKVALHLVRRSR